MIYLLDVNALVALGLLNHEFHTRVVRWFDSLKSPQLASCSITELGFVRVLSQSAYGFSVAQSRNLLLRLKDALGDGFHFVADAQDVSKLPGWVRSPKQITDGHLTQLAIANAAVFATLDERIPGAYVIPE